MTTPPTLPKKRIPMESNEFERSKVFIISDLLDYVPHSVVIKTIIRKTTGHVTAIAFDSGEALRGSISPFDTFIQVIEGQAELIMDDLSHHLETGHSFIVPAHARNTIKANVRFKMLSTIIKSGYEEVV